MENMMTLPASNSSNLIITQPTSNEFDEVYRSSFQEWGDALTPAQYLEEAHLMTTIPLAKNGGMTVWILTDKTLPKGRRSILSSCETFHKRALVKYPGHQLLERAIYGVASVFCKPEYRGNGYAARLLLELKAILPTWQTEAEEKCAGSVLYSDIGRMFYGKLGWRPYLTNTEMILDVARVPKPENVRDLLATDLDRLCRDDEAMIRKSIDSAMIGKTSMVIVPDIDHMGWHHGKEDFACRTLFRRAPQIKGAIAGEHGHRVWAIWSRRYHKNPAVAPSENVLYILRVVIEDQNEKAELPNDQVENLRAVITRAQVEAAQWSLPRIKLWDPSSQVQALVGQAGIECSMVERDVDGIASLLWFGEGNGGEESIEWLCNEKYGWC